MGSIVHIRHIFSLFLIVLTPTLSVHAFADTIDVCPACSVTTLGKALEQANDGDEIVLHKGIYIEHSIVITKSVTIRGEEDAVLDGESTIDGKSKGTILTIKADNVTIRSLTIRNVGMSHIKDFAAIKVRKSRNFVIENNILENVFFGIMIEKSKHGIIRNNHVSSHAVSEGSSGNGIHGWHSSNLRIENNMLTGLRDGIYLEFIKKSMIKDNIAHDNLRYGLHFMFSNKNEYKGNEFYKNGAGVAVMFSKFIVMKGNYFHDNWGTASYGLLLKEIYDAEIIGNTFERNTVGINTEGSTRINIFNNNFLANGWALKVTGACYENIYKSNNFIRNSFDLSYNSKLNDNAFESNYWASYTKYDLDRDGIGDIPHRPVKLFSYIVNKTPEAIVLLRSLFVDIINFSEKVSPVFTPDDILDTTPMMRENNVSF